MDIDEILATLSPKIAKQYRLAATAKTELLPLASTRLTTALNGGIGKGRITTIFGNQSSGKSLIMMESVAKWQKMGQTVAWVDTEFVWDKVWAERLGVDNDNLILIQKKGAAAIADRVVPLIEAGIDAVVLDSISDIIPESYLDDDEKIKEFNSTKQIGQHARSITRLINNLQYANENTTAIVLISQTTTDLSGMHPMQVPHGGKKVQFASSQIIKLTSSNTDAKAIKGDIWIGDRIITAPVGRTVLASVEKNKMGPQSRVCEYDIYYDGPFVGIDAIAEIVDDAVNYGVIDKGGAWLKYGDEQWQGRPALIKHAKENPALVARLSTDLHTLRTGEVKDGV